MKYRKYDAIGNDYVVLNPADFDFTELTKDFIRDVCDRKKGIGSDGILWGPFPSSVADVKVRIFNPDGSEAEKSGNGLRIFTRFLFDQIGKGRTDWKIETLGGVVSARVFDGGDEVEIDMGRPSDITEAKLSILGRTFDVSIVSMGNPHCVIILSDVTADMAKKYGPVIETDSLFPDRTNVQFVKVIDKKNIELQIWERGAGYTLASGTSSCAAFAIAHSRRLVGGSVTAHMPGGTLSLSFTETGSIAMRGAVKYLPH